MESRPIDRVSLFCLLVSLYFYNTADNVIRCSNLSATILGSSNKGDFTLNNRMTSSLLRRFVDTDLAFELLKSKFLAIFGCKPGSHPANHVEKIFAYFLFEKNQVIDFSQSVLSTVVAFYVSRSR